MLNTMKKIVSHRVIYAGIGLTYVAGYAGVVAKSEVMLVAGVLYLTCALRG